MAYNRALGTLAPVVPGFADPWAVEFLPANWRRKIERARESLKAHPQRSPYPFWMRSMAVFNQFRTVILDRAITAALPVPQLVILGAGFDARAWRLDGLRDTTIFEIDHPATQALKRTRAGALPPKARQIRFAATDFRDGDLARVLAETGHQMRLPTFWLWEGVTMYLGPAEVAANLATIAALSAPGSRLALTYMSKDRGRTPRSIFLTLLGEPVRSAYSPTEFSETAAACGWTAVADSGIEDWLRQLTPSLRLTRRQVGMQWFERIAVLEKVS